MKIFARVFVLLAGGGALGAPMAMAQNGMTEEPSAAVKSCIGTNAAHVERIFDSLREGAEFLINNACAGPVAEQLAVVQAERKRKAMEAQEARQKAMCDSRTNQPKSAEGQPDASAYLSMMCENPAMMSETYVMMDAFEAGYYGMPMNAPKAMTLASQTLLKLRIDRLDKKQ